MRNDAIGLFWEDRLVERIVKEKIKRTPPEPVWELPGYLPNLAEAQNLVLNYYTDNELIEAALNHEKLVFDCEFYPNLVIIGFRGVTSRKIVAFYLTAEDAKLNQQQQSKLRWVLDNFTTVGFNSIPFDIPMCELAMAGHTSIQLWSSVQALIVEQTPWRDLLKQYKVKRKHYSHIDLIEVCPLAASLKTYGGRLHTLRMQDLPFKPGTYLSEEQKLITLWYWNNDLDLTELIDESLKVQIKLREQLGERYGLDLRSKSDAQIAEAVISNQFEEYTGQRPTRPQVAPGSYFYYQFPAFLQFQTQEMQYVAWLISQTPFVINENGIVGMPPAIKDLLIPIGQGRYQMGIGGLHSTESTVSHVACQQYRIVDRDVASYYPAIILNLGLYPQHLGTVFLSIYKQLVDERLQAKRNKDKKTADTLKIVINGSYGKLGSPYSVLYSPNLLIQVTITGQLSLLMLIERLHLAGFVVLSANTDGIVVKVDRTREADYLAIFKQWELDTGFETEETEYKAIYSRDVNSYIAVKMDGTCKGKGAYGAPNHSKDPEEAMKKNPTGNIVVNAVKELLTKGTPVADTIRACTDPAQFMHVRNVKGGAVKVWDAGKTDYLGKVVRWYYGKDVSGEIVYANSGNKVSRSDGAVPCMLLPNAIPEDLDYDRYIAEAEEILKEIAYS